MGISLLSRYIVERAIRRKSHSVDGKERNDEASVTMKESTLMRKVGGVNQSSRESRTNTIERSKERKGDRQDQSHHKRWGKSNLRSVLGGGTKAEKLVEQGGRVGGPVKPDFDIGIKPGKRSKMDRGEIKEGRPPCKSLGSHA